MSEPATRPVQASSTVEGLKLITEGQRLAEPGTLASLNDALNKYNAAYELFRKDDLRVGIGIARFAAGAAYSSLGQKRKALEAAERALQIAREQKSRSSEATALLSLGEIYNSLGDRLAALRNYEEALRAGTEASDPTGNATALSNMAGVYLDLGETDRSIALYEEAIRIHETKGEPEDAASALNGLAGINDLQRDYAKESEYYLRARSLARSAEDRRGEATLLGNLGFLREKQGDLKAAEALHEQAIEARERLRSAARPEEFKTEMAGESAELYSRAILLKIKTGKPAAFKLSERARARTLLDQMNGARINLRRSADRELIGHEQSVRFELASFEKQLRGEILDAWLVAPVRRQIQTPRVCVIPHGILHQLSFAALYDGKDYFGERHTIYHLPAASLLPFVERRARPAGKRLLALSEAKAEGRPFLHYVDHEAGAIVSLYHGKALLSGQASKAEFLKLAGDQEILHIASHGELNMCSPLFSRVLLTPDQNGSQGLEVREIYDLNVSRASLVVLSVCESQLGAQNRGDDIVGLNRAFLYAGASTLIASLWTVDDRATGLLMRSFYTHLKCGMGKAEALHMAQSETRRQYANPYYWAAFVLTGNARRPGPLHTDGARRKTAWRRN